MYHWQAKSIFGAVLAASLAFGGSANATVINLNQWYEFGFGGVASALSSGVGFVQITNPSPSLVGAPAWTFSLSSPGKLFVADGFQSGDQFELFDSGVSIGQTSLPTRGSDCGSDLTCALIDTNFSRGSFALAAGNHSITGSMLLSPFGGGAGAFMVSVAPVPIPAALTLLLSGLGGLGFLGWRKKHTAAAA